MTVDTVTRKFFHLFHVTVDNLCCQLLHWRVHKN